MPPSKIEMALVKQHFEQNAEDCFTFSNLESLFLERRQTWNLPPSMTARTFLPMLLQKTKLRQLELRSRDYPTIVRYIWANRASAVSVARSLRNGAFFSHASALWAHGLSSNHRNVFINKEQSEKLPNRGPLSQEAIDRAFHNTQRHSRLVYPYHNTTITILAAKHTGLLGIERAKVPSGEEVQVTSLERTLVDVVVRPAYSGGAQAVLEAFRQARGRVSVTNILEILGKIDYTYPYHQALGFYLKRAGYPEADQQHARRSDLHFNFYLCHGLKDPAFDQEWKIFFPASLR
jgi:hypothetical protein